MIEQEKGPIGGVIVPLVTAINLESSGESFIDEIASNRHIDDLLKNGVHTLFLFGYAGGCTGDLSVPQRKDHLEHVLWHVDGQVPVVVGISHENLDSAVELARHAEDSNADAIVLLLNHSSKNYDMQVSTILESTNHIPLILYNNPHVGQKKCLQPVELKRMVKRYPERIIGLKESSGDEALFVSYIALQQYFMKRNIPFSLFMGDASKIDWVIRNQDSFGFELPGAVPVEANVPEKASLYVDLLAGKKPLGIEYSSIPQAISSLVSQGRMNPASLTFWNALSS